MQLLADFARNSTAVRYTPKRASMELLPPWLCQSGCQSDQAAQLLARRAVITITIVVFLFFSFTNSHYTRDSSHTLHRCSRDQSDGRYNSYSPVTIELWQRKPTSPSGSVLVLGWFTAMCNSVNLTVTMCSFVKDYLKYVMKVEIHFKTIAIF